MAAALPERRLVVVAGPNGSGKTTYTTEARADIVPEGADLLDPDAIAAARGLSPVAAGRVVIERTAAAFEAGRSIVLETTLAGNSTLAAMRRARATKYDVTLVYVATDDPQTNVARVAARVRRGGHDVPVADIIRRYQRSLANLAAAVELADRAALIDNSGPSGPVVIAVREATVWHVLAAIPSWARDVLAD